jgi:hypothetical protein
VSLPPEVVFHRFFTQSLSLAERQHYWGRADLERLPISTSELSLLPAIQASLNDALHNEAMDVPDHVPHHTFHCDYIDSDVPNAGAFSYGGYSFIGITIPLVRRLWDVCGRLSVSDAVTAAIGIRVTSQECERFRVVLFRIQLHSIVAHEFTHHVHGHVMPVPSQAVFADEIVNRGEVGNLDHQAREVDADGYATYFVLTNLINGEERQSVSLLNIETDTLVVQDEVLLACFVVAVGGWLYAREPQVLSTDSIYRFTHPPQAARMNFVMQRAAAWCIQNRPALHQWMTHSRFQSLMASVAEATFGMNGTTDWEAQIAFLHSDDGTEYIKRLDERFRACVDALGPRP